MKDKKTKEKYLRLAKSTCQESCWKKKGGGHVREEVKGIVFTHTPPPSPPPQNKTSGKFVISNLI